MEINPYPLNSLTTSNSGQQLGINPGPPKEGQQMGINPCPYIKNDNKWVLTHVHT